MLELLMDAVPRDARGVGADAQRAALRAAWMGRVRGHGVADRVDRTRIRVTHDSSNVAIATS
ncbi:hypothetical protein [Lysobacter capsici]|uniref:hypothetical protein n=1 Tax=Lysobacter capsici TaxID=435897 RepID=UPI00287BBDA5|nr:hypothetical protein [Lysobacter capsici]WND78561.1 hypothetical protein RJ610_14710 [Lysobacter capsici]WND83756.1 hypothetical protein RJ609_14720 [Lysobacter capsici]